jgi:hypothetical protein
VIRGHGGVCVMLDDYDRIALISKILKGFDESPVIALM